MRIVLSLVMALILCMSTTNAFAEDVVVRPTGQYSYERMERDIHTVQRRFPNLVRVTVIGDTPYHRHIYAISIGSGKRSVCISATHHAREWITSVLTMKMLATYCEAYQENERIDGYPVRAILNQTTIWFLPMVNPDGVTLQQRGPGAFPYTMGHTFIRWNHGLRDFTEWKANAQGVDLNHQYDGDWTKIKDSPRAPSNQGYKGSQPLQASEVKAVVTFLKKTNPDLEVSYHASGKVIFINGRTDPRLPYARDLADMTGYRVVSISDSYGGLTDWWANQLGKIGLTIEVGPFYGEKPVPLRYFQEIWNQNRAVGLYLASRSMLDRHPAR